MRSGPALGARRKDQTIEDEVIALRERLAVFYAAAMGALAMRGDSGLPRPKFVGDYLPYGFSDLLDDLEASTDRIVAISVGQTDSEHSSEHSS